MRIAPPAVNHVALPLVKTLKFADDTNIYRTVNSVEGTESLRTDLRNLVSWSTDWQMLFNIDKCKVVHLGHNNPQTNFVVDATQLQGVSEETGLGIIVSADLKWEQCIAAVKKVNKIQGMVKCNFIGQKKQLWPYTKVLLDHIWNVVYKYAISIWLTTLS